MRIPRCFKSAIPVDHLVKTLRILDEQDPVMRALLDELAVRVTERLLREVFAEGKKAERRSGNG